jgi:hypothetical protein
LRDWCKLCVEEYNKTRYDDIEIPKEKECNICFETLPLESFDKSKYGIYYRANTCKKCRNKIRSGNNYKRLTDGKKTCSVCKKRKDVSEFNSDKQNKDGLQICCKDCQIMRLNKSQSKLNGFAKKLFRDLKKNALNRNIKVTITVDDIFDLYEKQNGICVYSGIKMTTDNIPKEGRRYNNLHNISVDRIDSNKAYDKDNVQLVCMEVNIMKYDFDEIHFIELCTKISKHCRNTAEEKLSKTSVDDDIKRDLQILSKT